MTMTLQPQKHYTVSVSYDPREGLQVCGLSKVETWVSFFSGDPRYRVRYGSGLFTADQFFQLALPEQL
jgi:hypothetical protein